MWFVYILKCKDNTLYTGSTNNIAKRFAAHKSGKGARYTKGRGPLRLVYWASLTDKPAALRLEYAIKQKSRKEKLALIESCSLLPAVIASDLANGQKASSKTVLKKA